MIGNIFVNVVGITLVIDFETYLGSLYVSLDDYIAGKLKGLIPCRLNVVYSW